MTAIAPMRGMPACRSVSAARRSDEPVVTTSSTIRTLLGMFENLAALLVGELLVALLPDSKLPVGDRDGPCSRPLKSLSP